jgi:hypothetical protein
VDEYEEDASVDEESDEWKDLRRVGDSRGSQSSMESESVRCVCEGDSVSLRLLGREPDELRCSNSRKFE